MPSSSTTPRIALVIIIAAALFTPLTGCEPVKEEAKQHETAAMLANANAPASTAGEGEEPSETTPAATTRGGATAPESQPARELTRRELHEKKTLRALGGFTEQEKIPRFIKATLPFITRHEFGEKEGEVTVWFEGDSEPFSFTIDYETNSARVPPIAIEKPL